jgi:PleD family two-component response regulator
MRPPVLPVNDNAVVAERVRLRVLAVDDNAMVADEVAAMLSAAGLEVVGPATTPEDALDFALRRRRAGRQAA